MVKDIPDVFEGVVGVNEVYLGGQKKDKGKGQFLKKSLAKSQKGTWDNKTTCL